MATTSSRDQGGKRDEVFTILRLLRSGETTLTAARLSIERILGRKLDRRTDSYALRGLRDNDWTYGDTYRRLAE